MDYKEKYEQALSVARKTYQSQPMYRDWLEKMFPELSESEDEKIRTAIIHFISHTPTIPKGVIDKETMIAWLEKQTTPQVRTGLEWVNTIDDACDERYAEEYSHGEYCHEQSFKWGFQEGVEWLEKQAEQKPTNEDMKTLLRTEYEKGRADAIAEMQKEWSEEDSYYRNCIIQIIKEIKNAPLKRKEDWDAYINWLKSLKPHPKNEWSEDVEATIRLLKNIAEEQEKDYCPYNANDLRKAAQYLETCRPQSQWKPSEEQMMALKDALNDAIWKYNFKGSPIKEEVTRKHAETIESLYNDLKKLREE